MLIKNSDRIDQEIQLDEVYLISAHYDIASDPEPHSSDGILEIASPT